MKIVKRYWSIALLSLLVGCAGWSRGCSSWCAEQMGADWIIVQYDAMGHPSGCWRVDDESVTNEDSSDGIYWKQHGHLVHISGWYNRVQVSGDDYEGAAKLLGVELNQCHNGKYSPSVVVEESGPSL
jgi:hypothetical protein